MTPKLPKHMRSLRSQLMETVILDLMLVSNVLDFLFTGNLARDANIEKSGRILWITGFFCSSRDSVSISLMRRGHEYGEV